MNTAIHSMRGRYGLGAACGSGSALVHGILGTGLSTASKSLLNPGGSSSAGGAAEIGTGQAIAGAVLGVASLIQNFFGHPDCSKIATTQIVNQAEVFLQQNLSAWQALPAAEKTAATQQQALATFDYVWQQVVQACGSGQYGSAGAACINDRARGGKFDWFRLYRDPIANAAVTQSPAGAIAAAGLDPTWLIIGGAAALVFVLLL